MTFLTPTRAILGESPEAALRRALGSAGNATPEQVAAIWAKAARDAKPMDSFPSPSQIRRSGGSEIEWTEQ